MGFRSIRLKCSEKHPEWIVAGPLGQAMVARLACAHQEAQLPHLCPPYQWASSQPKHLTSRNSLRTHHALQVPHSCQESPIAPPVGHPGFITHGPLQMKRHDLVTAQLAAIVNLHFTLYSRCQESCVTFPLVPLTLCVSGKGDRALQINLFVGYITSLNKIMCWEQVSL